MFCFFFFLLIRRPPRSTRTYTLFPSTTLFRSPPADGKVIAGQIGTADMSGAKQRAPVDAFARSRYDNRGMYAIGSHEDGNALLRWLPARVGRDQCLG